MNFKELEKIAADSAVKAGKEILRLRQSGVQVTDTKSSATDVVTAADKLAEKMIVSAILEARPNDGVFGEEGAQQTGTSEITWVIDPIDGTVNYLYNLPAFCVSIAACVNDSQRFEDGRRAIASAVYNPTTGELFTAAEGHGAFRNEKAISVSPQDNLATALVATGFGYTKERRLEQIELLKKVITDIRDIRRIGSAAYDLCLLASGKIDGYFEKGIQPWDWAAGALIASEAGAALLGKDANSLPGESMFIAGNPLIARSLQDLLVS